MMHDKLRVAFIGCGRISDLQSLGYREHPRAEIVAVCDTDQVLARRRAREWGAARCYDDYRRLLEDPSIDAVEILTPHHLHAEHAVAALDAGKHVSLQKPPARTLAEFDAVIEASRRSGRTLRVYENFMHYPPHVLAKRLIGEGAIGSILSVRLKTAAGRPGAGWDVPASALAWRTDRERCGGGPTTFDHGYHCYHMARWFGPAEIERVHAFIHWNDLGGNAWYDGPALVSWRYQGDPARYGSWEVIASLGLHVRSQYYVSDDRTEIHGSEGILWINRCTGKLLEEPSVVIYRDGETRAFHDVETDWAASFRSGARDLIDCLLEGRQPPLDAAEARRTLAVAIAAGLSAAESREVTIAEVVGEENKDTKV